MDEQNNKNDVFQLLVRPIRNLLLEKSFQHATEPQKKVIPKILNGKNVLLVSPTATGKTEAAMLPILSMLLQIPRREFGIKVLYITPLRALNRDMLERMKWWCNKLDLKLAVRHGDTDTNERTRQTRSPPDIMITTPETLQALLFGWVISRHLKFIRWVVIDEVHELADNKRGSQLALAIERLREITINNFQMVGLSATIGTPQKVAKFLVGNDRPFEIVRVAVARLMKLQIIYPKPVQEDFTLASSLFTHPEVAARLRLIRKFIEEHQSVLLFTNTRTLSEVLASRFKVWDINFPISIHHGSLSKISRVIAEKGFKRGDLQGLICTSSLELGIDIGSIDLVIQYMSPRQVTRLIQRVGRSGHRIGRMAKGIIITMDSDDTLEALVIGRRAYNELLEPVEIPEKPYDALLNQIVGCLIKSRRLYFQEILEIFKMAYPYREISLDDIIQVSEYMHNRFPRFGWVDSEEKVIIKSRRSKPLYEYFFENLSMIPDEKHYLVIEHSKNIAIGILDEAFVAEYGKPTTKFIISGRAWMILSVTADKIYVKAVEDPTGSIPSWVGEEIPVPFEIAQEVGSIRRFVEDNIEKLKTSEIALNLSRKYPADQETILAAIYETCRSIDKDYLIPTDLRITFEEWEDFIILITHLGSLTNRALALSLGNSISEQIGYSVAVQHDPYRIFIKTTREIKAQTIIKKVIELSNLSPNNIEKTLTKACVKTGIFKRRMIHVARRFGALKKHVDFSNISLHNLVKSFENTIIYEEALKEVFNKDIDLKHLIKVFNEIKNGYIELVEVITSEEPTPIAKVGIEKVGMKTDLIPPEKMRSLLLESIKARLLFENRTFICTNCWDYTEVIGIKDLPDNPKCPKCGSLKLGLLKVDEEKTFALVDKKEGRLTKKEKELKIQAIKTSNIIAIHGKSAVLALTGRRLGINDAKKILSKENKLTNEFYELIMEAEKKALKRQFL